MIEKIKKYLRMHGRNLETRFLSQFDDSTYIDLAYQFILRRPPDVEGKMNYLNDLKKGRINREFFLNILYQSEEFKLLNLNTMDLSIHQSRILWVKNLPKADYILDLGGASKGTKKGALLSMGYPYGFKELIIVDLPLESRHSLYADGYDVIESYQSSSGNIRYVYTSMTDLAQFEDASMDLVNCGQTIEHIHEGEAEWVFKECMRILKPGKYLCLDTPNAKATRLKQKEFIDPDHKIEYRHEQLFDKLKQAGFQIVESKGLNYLPNSIQRNAFDAQEITKNYGIFDDIENCYILAYRCRKPT